MADIRSWNAAVPSGTSSIRDGDNQIRANAAFVQEVVNQEHYFDTASASSQSGGVHKLGSARVFMNATRASIATPASADSDGRLVYAADTQSLHVLGASSATTINWGTEPPGAQLFSASTNHGSSGNTVNVIAATENYDVGGYTSTGISAATVPSGFAGRHLITCTVRIASVVTGTVRLGISKGASATTYLAMSSVGSTNAPAALTVTAIDKAAAGDAYYPFLFQNSGGALNLADFYFSVQRL